MDFVSLLELFLMRRVRRRNCLLRSNLSSLSTRMSSSGHQVKSRLIYSSMYMCDSRFHVEALEELLENDSKWGFIIM